MYFLYLEKLVSVLFNRTGVKQKGMFIPSVLSGYFPLLSN